ncbi:MAG TPA: TonB-dependent receptor [Myxococcota bacterium]
MTPAPVAQRVRYRCARAGGPLSFSVLVLVLTSFAARGIARAEEPVVREAAEVSVTATRGERNPLDVPAHVTVIDRAAIERSGAASVPDLLRREAGLFVTNTTTNPEGFGVEARGFQNGGGNGCRTLVLIDGRRANEPDTGCADWTFVPLGDVERIEIVRGPGSAIYGDNAIGGVVEIFTRQPGAEGTSRASLDARGGSYGTGDLAGSVSSSFGALGVGLFSNYASTNGFRERSDYEAKSSKLDLTYDLGDLGRAGLTFAYGSNERARPGAIFVEYATRDGEQASLDVSNGVDRERSVQGSLALNLPGDVALRATPHYRRTTSITDAVFSPGFAFHFDDEQESGGIDLQLSRDFEVFARPIRLLGGGEYRREDFEGASAFASNTTERDIWGLFLQSEITLADDWLLSAGVRYDATTVDGQLSAPLPECNATTLRCEFDDHEWSPRAALTWRFADPGAIWLSFSEGFRFPNLNEAFGFFGFSPALAPEHSQGFELGGKWSGERWRGTVVFHHSRVRDEIFFNPLAPNPLPGGFPGVNQNVDDVEHRGVELSASWRLLEWLELYGAYTFDDVTVIEDDDVPAFEGAQLPITPRHHGSAGVRATLAHGFEASVDAIYVGERRLANDVAPPSDFLPSYATYQARIGWARELAPGVSLALEAVGRNLNNRHYAEWGGLSTFTGAVGYFPSPERNFSAGARIQFER